MLRYKPTKSVIAKKRERLLRNVFCPTGKGGGVDPSCSSKMSKIKYDISKKHSDLITKHFGYAQQDIAGLVGAQPGATVKVQGVYIATSEYGTTYISVAVDHPDYEARRTIEKDKIINDSIEIKKTGQGLGTKIFSEQVEYAKSAGFKLIETSATRGHEVNGYYTWARLGYDAKLPMMYGGKPIKSAAQQIVPGAERVSDLMKSPEGRSWWKEHGVSFEGEFDLSDNSLGLKVLREYKANKSQVSNESAPNIEGDESLLDRIWDTIDLVGNAKKATNKKIINPLKTDPTRSATLRRIFLADLTRRFKALDREIQELVVTQDEFGLKAEELANPWVTNAAGWRWEPNDKKIELFRQWLASKLKKIIYDEGSSEVTGDAWWDAYIQSAYQKGLGRAWDQIKKSIKGATEKLDFFAGTREQFLQSAFNRPVHRDKVKLMAGRTFNDLKGVTDAMSTKITRTLVDGLIQGQGPIAIAKQMSEDVSTIGLDRAKTIARTEITRVHAEGQLDAMERLGVKEVGVSVEWSTAEDEAVCPLCQPMEGVVLSIEESRGLLPRHPNCRCAFVPANIGEDTEGQKRSQSSISKAIEASLKAEMPKKTKKSMAEQKASSKWGGAKAKISKDRPKSILDGPIGNVFCPTGKGGGIDPTCSPPSSGRESIGNFTHPDELVFHSTLGGSTGAKLMTDMDGNKFVVKKGTSPGHIRAEYAAERAYEAAGLNVPTSVLYETDDGPVKVSKFIEGKTFDQLSPEQQKELIPEIQKGFAVDALLANWDVIGMSKDNIMLGNDGKVYRIDTGGSLDYRAKGGLKGGLWNTNADEFESMRSGIKNPQAKEIFGSLTDEQLKSQVAQLVVDKEDILKALPEKYHYKIESRIESLQIKAMELKQASTTQVTPKAKDIVPTNTHTHLHSGGGLHAHLTKNNGDIGLTKVQIEKIKLANPDGLATGKLTIPLKLKGTPELEQLKKYLPEGTVLTHEAMTIPKLKGTSPTATPIAKSAIKKAQSQDLSSTLTGTITTAQVADYHPSIQHWAKGLTAGEKGAISTWKGSAADIRHAFASDPPPPPSNPDAKNFWNAISKAPPVEGVGYRGLRDKSYITRGEGYATQQINLIKAAGVGGTWTDISPHGMSRGIKTAKGFASGQLMLKIKAKTARSIEHIGGYKDEKEFIGMPGTKYKILAIHEDKGFKAYVELEEI